ncbi:MAG: D-cysteine desulfhydrase [Myxococcota bacterium]|jgi:D-cysteine desulfhydrase
MEPEPTQRSALQARFPGVVLPRVPLGSWPGPITRLAEDLYSLDEGVCSPVYGGNKVRKLEHILAGAGDAVDVITMGAAGSHHVLATAIHGTARGLRAHALLVPQPDTAHVQATLRRSLARCTTLTPTTPASLLPDLHAMSSRLHRETGKRPLIVPIGGSSLEGVLGWISGGLEVAAAIADGRLPRSVRVYAPLGSGGTVAGLLAGLRLAGLATVVVGVRVVDRPLGYAWQVRALAHAALQRLRSAGARIAGIRMKGLQVEEGWREGGYGVVTPRIEAIVTQAASLGIPVETTYTARCLGAVLAAQRDGPVLLVQTLNTRPLPEGPPLTPDLRRLLT